MTRMTRFLSVLAIAAATMTATAQAETTAKTGNVEIFAGWYWPENESTVADPSDDWTYGLRLGYNFTNRFGLQFGVQGLNTDYNLTAPLSGSADIDALMTDLSLIWHANPDDRAVFHVFGGPGYSWSTIEAPSILDPKFEDDDDVFTMHLGIGVNIYATKNFYIRPDVAGRWFFEDEDNALGPGTDGDSHTDWQFTLGLGWEWGGN